MKYRLNKLPVKTTNNFKINDVEVDIEIPNYDEFSKFKIDNNKDISFTQNVVDKKINSRIGLEFDKYLELVIDIPKNINDTIVINYDFDSNCLVDKIIFNYQENSNCNFIIKYHSLDYAFHHLLCEANLASNSSGNITIINDLSKESNIFVAGNSSVLENSNFTFNIVDLNGSIRVYNYYSEVMDNGTSNLNNIFIGKNRDSVDQNYYIKHIGKESISDIKVEGVLDDYSKKIFRGTIDFVSGCSSAIGSEYENVVLLSDNCISRSLPQMLCGEENVVGNHGVSSGCIPADKLFYLESRGFTKEEALRLIILANFNRLISFIPSEEVADEIRKKVELEIK